MMISSHELTVDDRQFLNAVIAHVDDVECQLSTLDSPEAVKKMIVQSDALHMIAYKIKANALTINQLAYAKLLLCARYGQLLVRQPPGRGKKSSQQLGGFSKNTITAYRTLGDHIDEIKPYYSAVCKELEKNPEASDHLTMTGFLGTINGKRPAKAKYYTGNAEWYTPHQYLEAARATMGGIDLDPASSDVAQENVRAARYFTTEDDGLQQPWQGNVWLNPPYNRALINQFVAKLLDEVGMGHVSQAIVLTNASTDTKWWHDLIAQASAICFTLGRISYNSEQTNITGQSFFYVGSNYAPFAKAFSAFGSVVLLAPHARVIGPY